MQRLLCLASLLAACAGAGPDGFEPPDVDPSFDGGKGDGPGSAWTGIGLGVEYQQVNTGGGVLIAYGGYTARMSYSAAWATELVDARLGGDGVGHIYAVKGPSDPSYAAREIGNSKLRAHLVDLDDGTSPIYVVAHSSGSFVAHELFRQLAAHGDTGILGRIHYANLDGGGSGLTDEIVDAMAATAFVYARDPAVGDSKNASTARYLGDAYAPKATTFRVTVAGTGCVAAWCLHDVVVTHRPHTPTSFDLARDYTDFANRTVTTEYFDAL